MYVMESDAAPRESDWALWEQRYRGLQTMLGILEEEVDAAGGVPRSASFKALLAQFRAFADRQFNFLYNGFHPAGGQGYRLEPSLQYSADFVLGGTLDQVAFDLTVLQGAWYQRTLARENDAMKRTFEIADRLAHFALLPAVWHELLPYEEEEVTVLTYFQKAPHIRVIPYATVALVGIPFTALATYEADDESEVGNVRDLLAIPHEVGHYVYQHGRMTNSRLQFALFDVLQGKPAWLLDWAEEIFADVYGCLIAGPVIVRDFQDLMRDNDVASFLEDDGEHPTPVLRPLLYCDALRILADRLGDEADGAGLRAFADEAEARWHKLRRSRGDDHLRDRRGMIRDAVEATFDLLVRPEDLSIGRLWSSLDPDASADKQYDDLYARFYEDAATGKLFDRLAEHTPAAEDATVKDEAAGEQAVEAAGVGRRPPELNAAWRTPEERIPTLRWLREIRNRHAQDLAGEQAPEKGDGGAQAGDDGELIPAEVWTLVASMHGWATNGPEDQPEPKAK